MKAKIILSVLLLTAVFGFAGSAFALTEAERQALIEQLQAQINELIRQVAELLAQQQVDPNWCHTFNVNLGYAESGSAEVSYLHIALDKEGMSYSPDTGTTYGEPTMNAVARFQQKYAISPTSGWVGPLTRTKLNQLHGCGVESCTPNWVTGSWSTCANGLQTRTVTDSNNCGVLTGKPATSQGCTVSCTPSWTTGAWSTCANGLQTRTVTDSNNCGVTTGKPAMSQSCTAICTPSWVTGAWGTCANGLQTRTVTDSNNCGVLTGKPATSQGCTVSCTPNWQTGAWSTCSSGRQTRTVTDSNNCGVTTGKPAISQSCTSQSVCEAVCVTQPDGIYAISCTGNITKCSTGKICENTYNTSYELIDGQVETIQTLTGTRCVTPPCIPSWVTGAWGVCTNGHQTRTVTDSNSCNTTTDKPATSQTCTPICVTNWQCTAWSSCTGGQRTRTCTDSNSCGTIADKPLTAESCTVPPPTVDLKIIFQSVSSNGPVTIGNNTAAALTWTSTDATSCTASGGWSGNKATSGSQSSSLLTATTTFNIICQGEGGTATDSVTANTTTQPMVSLKVNDTADSVTVQQPSDITITWTSLNTGSCKLYTNYSTNPFLSATGWVQGGSTTISPYGSTTRKLESIDRSAFSVDYSVVCNQPGAYVTDNVTVSVEQGPPLATLNAEIFTGGNNTSVFANPAVWHQWAVNQIYAYSVPIPRQLGQVELRWSSSNVGGCWFTGPNESRSVPVSGEEIINITSSQLNATYPLVWLLSCVTDPTIPNAHYTTRPAVVRLSAKFGCNKEADYNPQNIFTALGNSIYTDTCSQQVSGWRYTKYTCDYTEPGINEGRLKTTYTNCPSGYNCDVLKGGCYYPQ